MPLYPFVLHWERCKKILQSSFHWTFSWIKKKGGNILHRCAAPETQENSTTQYLCCQVRKLMVATLSLGSVVVFCGCWDSKETELANQLREPKTKTPLRTAILPPPPPDHETFTAGLNCYFSINWAGPAISVICLTSSLLPAGTHLCFYLNSSFPGWRGRKNFFLVYITLFFKSLLV